MSMRQRYGIHPETGVSGWWYEDEGPASALTRHGTAAEGSTGVGAARSLGAVDRYAIQRRQAADQPRREAA